MLRWWLSLVLLQCDDRALLAELLLFVVESELGIFRLRRLVLLRLLLLGWFRIVRFDVVHDDSSGMSRDRGLLLRWRFFTFAGRVLRITLIGVRSWMRWLTG